MPAATVLASLRATSVAIIVAGNLATPTPTPPSTARPTRTATPSPTPTPPQGGASDSTGAGTLLPDLVITGIAVQLESGGDCGYTSTALGLRVSIKNQGDNPAGPFVVVAYGSQAIEVPGLESGAAVSLWLEGYAYSGENTVLVDATHMVVESDESNNVVARLLPIPTLPPTCTPTPSALSSPTPPSPTRTATPTPPPTPTVPPPPSPTPRPTATRVPTPTAMATTAPSGQPDVQIACIFYDGVVSSQEPDEYVEIVNLGDGGQDLQGWTLEDISDGNPTPFLFPSWTLEPGGRVRVYTNQVHPEWGGFSFERGTAAWNNSAPDTAGLKNQAGELVSTKSYPPGC